MPSVTLEFSAALDFQAALLVCDTLEDEIRLREILEKILTGLEHEAEN